MTLLPINLYENTLDCSRLTDYAIFYYCLFILKPKLQRKPPRVKMLQEKGVQPPPHHLINRYSSIISMQNFPCIEPTCHLRNSFLYLLSHLALVSFLMYFQLAFSLFIFFYLILELSLNKLIYCYYCYEYFLIYLFLSPKCGIAYSPTSKNYIPKLTFNYATCRFLVSSHIFFIVTLQRTSVRATQVTKTNIKSSHHNSEKDQVQIYLSF